MNENLARSKNKNMSLTFGSACHSAGRIISHSQAKKTFAGQDINATLDRQGIKVKTTHPAMLAEDAPQVFKPSNKVVDVFHNLRIATKVAKLLPIGVSKG